MKTSSIYGGHRFPPTVISLAVRWYFRFSLRLRDIEELLFERDVIVSYESIRRWCDKFGALFAAHAKITGRIAKTWPESGSAACVAQDLGSTCSDDQG
ncbi:putative transposase [Robbsia andropogonis]